MYNTHCSIPCIFHLAIHQTGFLCVYVCCFICFLSHVEREIILQFNDLHVVMAHCTDNKQDAQLNAASASGQHSLKK